MDWRASLALWFVGLGIEIVLAGLSYLGIRLPRWLAVAMLGGGAILIGIGFWFAIQRYGEMSAMPVAKPRMPGGPLSMEQQLANDLLQIEQAKARNILVLEALSVSGFLTAFGVLLVLQANSLLTLQANIQDIRQDFGRYVLPRQMTLEQQEAFSAYLSQYPPQEITFKIAQNDNEASGYRVDIDQAIRGGGWKAKTYLYEPNLQQGLGIHLMLTAAHSSIQSGGDPKNPRVDEILRNAFQVANIRIDRSGSGGGGNITEDVLTVEIGPRRRDGH